MTHQVSTRYAAGSVDAGRQLAQLSHVLRLVEQIGGIGQGARAAETALDENARISGTYSDAAAIVQRRFDALVMETSIWAATAVQALVAARDDPEPPRAAARRLADELATSLDALLRILRN
jgi:hypothetical protein